MKPLGAAAIRAAVEAETARFIDAKTSRPDDPLAAGAATYYRMTPEARQHIHRIRDEHGTEAAERALIFYDPLSLACHLDPSIEPHPHSVAISATCRIVATTGSRAVISTPPQHGKSTIVAVWFVVWYLAVFVSKKIGTASYNLTLARKASRETRDIINAHAAFLGLDLLASEGRADEWQTEQGGGYKAAGVNTGLTGFPLTGGLVVDDPFKNWRDAKSEARRNEVAEWFDSVADSRLHPGAFVIVIATPWDPDDLSGRLLKASPSEWADIRLPALADPDRTGGTDIIGRKKGRALAPAMFPLSFLLKRRARILATIWQTLYQCDPQPVAENSIVRPEWWKTMDRMPSVNQVTTCITCWDATFDDSTSKKTAGSMTAYAVWAKLGNDSNGARFLLIDAGEEDLAFDAQRDRIREVAAQYPYATHHHIEKKANGAALISTLQRGETVGAIPPLAGVEPYEPNGSKVERLYRVAPLVQNGHVYVAGWHPPDASTGQTIIERLVAQVAAFPQATRDDLVDVTSMGLDVLGGFAAMDHRDDDDDDGAAVVFGQRARR